MKRERLDRIFKMLDRRMSTEEMDRELTCLSEVGKARRRTGIESEQIVQTYLQGLCYVRTASIISGEPNQDRKKHDISVLIDRDGFQDKFILNARIPQERLNRFFEQKIQEMNNYWYGKRYSI